MIRCLGSKKKNSLFNIEVSKQISITIFCMLKMLMKQSINFQLTHEKVQA